MSFRRPRARRAASLVSLMATLIGLLGVVALAAAPADAARPHRQLVRGVVVDQTGTPVDDVLVQAVDDFGDVAATALTYASRWPSGPQHGYFFLEVDPGTYSIEISKPGYRRTTIDEVTVTRRQGVRLGEVELKRRLAVSRTTGALVDSRVTTADDVLVKAEIGRAHV